MGDTMHVFRTNIEQLFADQPSVDGAPMAEGDIDGLVDGTMYLALQRMYDKVGGIYKLCFGPKSFMVVSDPVIMKHILQGNTKSYDKGVLAEILEPIMGKGLIPADAETWKIRRRAIVPGFHQKWIERMVLVFGEQTVKATKYLDDAAAAGKAVDVEERLGSLALDIIGRAIFDYDFNSTADESPIVKAAISTLKEAEHRSMTPLPYWNLPFATDIVPRQVEFKKNMALLNDRLDACITKALQNRKEEDVDALQNRDYAAMENPSMLRFMVDMRDEDVTSRQLRDDLMTMLVAGHETTASALTWAIFELVQQPALLARLQAEVDQVLPADDSLPTLDTLRKLKLTRLSIAESLRMYPEPPLLIRRAIEEDTLPVGTGDTEVKLLRGMDLFLSVYNMQRSPLFWDNPDTFDPDRFLRKKESTVKGWAGFDPAKWEKQWYPNEAAADWAYLPFGGGPRKCVGDQFAMLEATVGLAMLVRRYEFEFAAPTATPDKVGTATGATIHTKNGMWMKVRRRTA
jgi:cytochrome P450